MSTSTSEIILGCVVHTVSNDKLYHGLFSATLLHTCRSEIQASTSYTRLTNAIIAARPNGMRFLASVAVNHTGNLAKSTVRVQNPANNPMAHKVAERKPAKSSGNYKRGLGKD